MDNSDGVLDEFILRKEMIFIKFTRKKENWEIVAVLVLEIVHLFCQSRVPLSVESRMNLNCTLRTVRRSTVDADMEFALEFFALVADVFFHFLHVNTFKVLFKLLI